MHVAPTRELFKDRKDLRMRTPWTNKDKGPFPVPSGEIKNQRPVKLFFEISRVANSRVRNSRQIFWFWGRSRIIGDVDTVWCEGCIAVEGPLSLHKSRRMDENLVYFRDQRLFYRVNRAPIVSEGILIVDMVTA